MNEQLIVKNFGPITDATVDFKRVTVFIGPTGGGKSTLAKLAAIFRGNNIDSDSFKKNSKVLNSFSIGSFIQDKTSFNWLLKDNHGTIPIKSENIDNQSYSERINLDVPPFPSHDDFEDLKARLIQNQFVIHDWEAIKRVVLDALTTYQKEGAISTNYITSNRTFIPAVEYSWAGFLRDDIGLPKETLDFANDFSLSRKDVSELEIPFLNVKYLHRNGQDFIQVPGVETLFRLYETASGIQSVTPLLVLLEHLSRNTEQAQSFIIEEPELNLYPTAQRGLLNWLVEKCTKGENDLTITTHSPYILSHLNLLLYAYQVAHDHPDRAEEVAEVVPRASWINPKEFACYQVENGGVTSLVSKDLGLIDDNGLDSLSGDAADAFDNLIRLSKAVARK